VKPLGCAQPVAGSSQQNSEKNFIHQVDGSIQNKCSTISRKQHKQTEKQNVRRGMSSILYVAHFSPENCYIDKYYYCCGLQNLPTYTDFNGKSKKWE